MDHLNITQKDVFLVEDAPAVRARLAELVCEVPGARVVGEAATPGEALEGIHRTKPAFVVLDLQLKGGSGLEVLDALHAVIPMPVVVILTNHVEPGYRERCLARGAVSFLDKTTEFNQVRTYLCAWNPPDNRAL
jgi:DNA-binding NarL/FixJ family response regulator